MNRAIHRKAVAGSNVVPFPARPTRTALAAKPVHAMTAAEKEAYIRFLIRDIAAMVDGRAGA